MAYHKNSALSLADGHEIASALLDSSRQTILATDENGRIVMANKMAEVILGYSHAELLSINLTDILEMSERPATFCIGEGKRVRAKRKNGASFSVEVDFNNIKTDAYGQLAVAFITDVTARDIREQRLCRANEDLQQFAYAASHDLQEPLRMISNFMQLVQRHYGHLLPNEEPDGEPGPGSWVRWSIEGAWRMNLLIKGLLEFTRINEVAVDAVNIDAVIADVLADLRLQTDEVDLVVHKMPTVMGDRVQLTNVFRNLISNAIKYRCPDRPLKVEITTSHDEYEWVFAIQDNGVGIPHEFINSIFKMFKRLNANIPGTGIGLAICKRVVERHHGRLWAESEVGVGSKFFFTISRSIGHLLYS